MRLVRELHSLVYVSPPKLLPRSTGPFQRRTQGHACIQCCFLGEWPSKLKKNALNVAQIAQKSHNTTLIRGYPVNSGVDQTMITWSTITTSSRTRLTAMLKNQLYKVLSFHPIVHYQHSFTKWNYDWVYELRWYPNEFAKSRCSSLFGVHASYHKITLVFKSCLRMQYL